MFPFGSPRLIPSPSSCLGCMTVIDMRLRLTFVIRRRRFTASRKHNAFLVLQILWGYEIYISLSCIYYLNLIDFHISFYCISIILVYSFCFNAAIYFQNGSGSMAHYVTQPRLDELRIGRGEPIVMFRHFCNISTN
jgi:hypothetical protein